MLPLYALTLCLSALLMFWVQPLYARLTLPLLGGAPAVWITAMLFFQAGVFHFFAGATIQAPGRLAAGRTPAAQVDRRPVEQLVFGALSGFRLLRFRVQRVPILRESL